MGLIGPEEPILSKTVHSDSKVMLMLNTCSTQMMNVISATSYEGNRSSIEFISISCISKKKYTTNLHYKRISFTVVMKNRFSMEYGVWLLFAYFLQDKVFKFLKYGFYFAPLP